MLTIKNLKAMNPNEIFAKGIGMDGELEIRWIACRGRGYHDWCIYYGKLDWSEYRIHREGDKMFTESKIKNLVACNEKAFKLYRF